jgi:NACalpha-BTF3-like transcription factor
MNICDECADSGDIIKFYVYKDIRECVFKYRKRDKIRKFVDDVYDPSLITCNGLKQYNLYLAKKKNKSENESDKDKDNDDDDISDIDIDLIDENDCIDDDTCSECIESINSDSHDGFPVICYDCQNIESSRKDKENMMKKIETLVLENTTMILKIEAMTLEI